MRNILVFMGTRPEAVKLAPVVAALRATNDFR
jgi:UDP-N-acetylglucosamine 2-epimerase